MARYVAYRPVEFGQFRFPVGTTFADTSVNKLGTDIIIAGLAGFPLVTSSLLPIDAAGQTALGGSIPLWTGPGDARLGWSGTAEQISG